MITLTAEQAQQIEEALVATTLNKDYWLEKCMDSLDTIRAARAQEQAEQPVSQEYQDHLVNQSFDWAAMAAKHQFMEGYRIGLAEMREKCAKVCDDKHDYMCSRAAEAIRSINFEGDTGFRPVSEMIAEQDPVSMFEWQNGNPVGLRKAAPVRTKYLTDAEIADIGTNCGTSMWSLMFARAVIAADRRKNK